MFFENKKLIARAVFRSLVNLFIFIKFWYWYGITSLASKLYCLCKFFRLKFVAQGDMHAMPDEGS